MNLSALWRRASRPALLAGLAALVSQLLILALPAPVAAQFGSQATLTIISLPVDVQHALSGEREPGSSGATLGVGDRIFTGADGQARLTFFQGTEVDIGPNSEILVRALERRPDGSSLVAISQAIGRTFMRLAALLNPRSRFELETPSAAAVVRGTEFEVNVTPEGIQIFRGVSGTFDVVAGGVTQSVRDGEVVIVLPAGRVLPPPSTRGGPVSVSADPAPLPPVPVAQLPQLLARILSQLQPSGSGAPAAPTPVPTATESPTPRPTVTWTATPRATATAVPPADGGGSAAAPPAPTATPSATLTVIPTPLPTSTPTASATSTSVPPGTATAGPGLVILAGRVLSASGVPIPSAAVTVYNGAVIATAIADATGAYRVDVPRSAYDLVANATGYTQQAIPYVDARNAPPQTTVFQDITLAANNALLSGTVRDSRGGALPGSALTLGVTAVSQPMLTVSTAPAPTGAFAWSVASGVYGQLTIAQQPDATFSTRQLAIGAPSIPPGATSQDFMLPTLQFSPASCNASPTASCVINILGDGFAPGVPVELSLVGQAIGVQQLGQDTPSAAGAFNVNFRSSPPWPPDSYAVQAVQIAGNQTRRVVTSTRYAVGSTAP